MTIIAKEQQKLCLVHYEKWMFEEMYKRLKKSKDLEKSLKNAILESFLIHTRNLIEFFQGTDKKAPHKKNCFDIIISDFIDKKGEKFVIVKEGEWKITQEHKKKINKRLSHLSEERLDRDEDWSEEIKIFKEEIEKKFNSFVKDLSNEYFPIECVEKFKLSKDNFKMTLNKEPEMSAGKEPFAISDTASDVA